MCFLRAVVIIPVILMTILACAEFNPRPVDRVNLFRYAESQSRDGITVTTAVPSIEEAQALFNTNLHEDHIQPVWISIQNNSENPVWFHPYSLDPEYYSPHEVAWISHRTGSTQTNSQIDVFYQNLSMPYFIPTNKSREGFVFVPLRLGMRYIRINLYTYEGIELFEYFIKVPGFTTDYDSIDFDAIYPPSQITDLENEEALREWVRSLPCCTMNKKGTTYGDPINIIIVASQFLLKRGFLRTGWDETAVLNIRSAGKTAMATLKGEAFLNAPFSPLYVFNRQQDIGMQKARQNIAQRNHLRLWLSPVTYRGTPVWVGQISRDIGIRMTTKSTTLTTHKIDPQVDDVRDGLILDMYAAKVVDAYGFVKAMQASTFDKPYLNLTDDPYYTDGLRAVMIFLKEPVPKKQVRYLDWDEADSVAE